MKKFRTWHDARIDAVEVIRETAKYVIIKEKKMYSEDTFERRDAKRTDIGYNYFDAWQEARQFLIVREKANIDGLEKRIAHHREVLQKIGEMSQP